MTVRKSILSEKVAVLLAFVLFVLLWTPFILFEMNAHSGVKTEYTVTKVGWLMYRVIAGENRLVMIRDRETARMVGSSRGMSYSALTEEFYLNKVSTELKKDQYYEFQLRCTKIGTLPELINRDKCDILSVLERNKIQ